MRRGGGAAAAAAFAVAAAAATCPAALAQEEPAARAWVDLVARARSAQAPPSWLDGGFGRLDAGTAGAARDESALAGAELGLRWEPSDLFTAHLHARARAEETAGGAAAGLVEAWVEGAIPLRSGSDRLRLRAGQQFLPTSRENVGPLWSSPYTVSLSALNSWIAEEIRPLGLLAEYELGAAGETALQAGAAAFYGNDAAGALLAWRGWALHDRLSVTGERLPLPPLDSLGPGGPFSRQDPGGTTPIGADLDGRPGWASYLRWRWEGLPAAVLLQATRFDNRGDLALHDGEYAWDTELDHLAVEARVGGDWVLAAEHLDGTTAMGHSRPLPADVAYRASYLLASWERLPLRLTGRWERFRTVDRDRRPGAERNDEEGEAWTAALRWQAAPALAVTLELLEVRAERRLAHGSDARRDDGGTLVTLAARYRVGEP